MTLLVVRDLVSDFLVPGGSVRAVDGVDLDVEHGEFVAVVGESGCGKTALALSLIGLMPDGRAAHPRGSVFFNGLDLVQAPADAVAALRGRQIGMIFQEPMTSLNPVHRIGKQVAEPLVVHGLADRREAERRAVAALGAVGIPAPERVARQYPHELSGGMRQRAMIAMATIAEPSLLIADEPTTALDVTVAAQILDLLRDMRERTGMAIIFVTHDLGVVAQAADRVVVMYAGEVVEMAPVSELFTAPRHPYTRGLLECMPRGGRREPRLRTIPGTVPQPQARPSGCRFAPRCVMAEPACAGETVLGELGASRVRCRRAAEIEQHIGVTP